MFRAEPFFTFLTVLACACGFVGAAEDQVTLIRGARVFDGTSVAIAPTDVLLRAGTIEQLGKSIHPPAGATVVDAAGCTLLPGLIDSHTHVISDTMLEQALIFGVTTELDMFMSHQQA